MSKLHQGKVAQIVNERELAINIGSQQGVAEGMRFAVLAPSTDVRDPDSGEVLGTIERTKVRVEASRVAPLFSICRTYEKKTIGGGTLSDLLSMGGTFTGEPRRQVFVTLSAEEEAFLPPLSPEESYVQIGDPVREIPPEPA